MVGRKSSATVQQMQPLASSTMSSARQVSSAQPFSKSPSKPSSPNSLTFMVRRLPVRFAIIWRIWVLLSAPRNPVTMVAGILLAKMGSLRRRDTGEDAAAEQGGALAARQGTVRAVDILGGELQRGGGGFPHRHLVAEQIAGLALGGDGDRAGAVAAAQAFDRLQRDLMAPRPVVIGRLDHLEQGQPVARAAGHPIGAPACHADMQGVFSAHRSADRNSRSVRPAATRPAGWSG